jgi:D-3-phosphoglycerate dehydrogenase / 2-oxoglutarate reductase
LGYVESGGYELYFEAAFANVAEFFAGRPVNILNPQADSR